MKMNLQMFGGRGSSSGISSKSGVIDKTAKERTIEAIYRQSNRGSYYKDEILEAVDAGNGEVHFQYASPVSRQKTAKTSSTQYLTYKLKAGSENGEIFGVNWDKVKSVSGQTYNIKSEIKDKGFTFDGKTKTWIRK